METKELLKKMRRDFFITSEQYSLKDLRVQLMIALEDDDKNKDKDIMFDFCDMVPDGIRFNFKEGEGAIGFVGMNQRSRTIGGEQSLKAGAYLSLLRRCESKHLNTPMWVCNVGERSDTGIVGIEVETSHIIIKTAFCEY